ncbi:MAG: prephenate dehydrogenase, partial [Anaerolineales bacterium]|nr:prephenate dehydrogenase [Anaerolineales bacterium]
MAKLPPPFRAVGGHPMCGKEVAGLPAATADLYDSQVFILTRNQRTDKVAETLAEQVVTAVGAHSLWLEPQKHDDMVAAVSHLPYLVSAVLMAVVAPQATPSTAETAQGDERLWQVSASGFRDTARLSGSDAAMLRDILLTNQTAVLAQLRAYQKQFTAVQALIKRGDENEISAWLQARQGEYAQYRHVKDEG